MLSSASGEYAIIDLPTSRIDMKDHLNLSDMKVNLDRRAETVVFALPQLRFVARFRIKDRCEESPMKADTLLIEPDAECFSICFRSTCNLGIDFRFLKSVTYEEGAR